DDRVVEQCAMHAPLEGGLHDRARHARQLTAQQQLREQPTVDAILVPPAGVARRKRTYRLRDCPGRSASARFAPRTGQLGGHPDLNHAHRRTDAPSTVNTVACPSGVVPSRPPRRLLVLLCDVIQSILRAEIVSCAFTSAQPAALLAAAYNGFNSSPA